MTVDVVGLWGISGIGGLMPAPVPLLLLMVDG
jgi:hypothetical protein